MFRHPPFFLPLALAVCLLLGAGAFAYMRFSALSESVFRGSVLYAATGLDASANLAGHMTGHTETLPTLATRCSNCHLQRDAKPVADRQFGPVLTGDHLLKSIARRGGPPTVYDERSFCRVLRDGIDPASVIIDQAMPRYTASDAQCQDLWNYLTRST